MSDAFYLSIKEEEECRYVRGERVVAGLTIVFCDDGEEPVATAIVSLDLTERDVQRMDRQLYPIRIGLARDDR